jgi:hypothetical protein
VNVASFQSAYDQAAAEEDPAAAAEAAAKAPDLSTNTDRLTFK